jgi:hypothetical protein
MEIKSLISKKRVLFVKGELPFDSLFAPDKRQALATEFKFETFEFAERANLPLIRGTRGQFIYKEKVTAIMEMNIQPVYYEAIIEGPTEGADYLLDSIDSLIRGFSISERPEKCKPQEVSHETFCVCRLEADGWWQISKPYSSFVKECVLPQVVNAYPNADPVMQPGSVKFRFQFKMKVADHLIAPKTFAIEVREGSPLEDRIFWTTSPLRSDQHLEILKQFEKLPGHNISPLPG